MSIIFMRKTRPCRVTRRYSISIEQLDNEPELSMTIIWADTVVNEAQPSWLYRS